MKKLALLLFFALAFTLNIFSQGEVAQNNEDFSRYGLFFHFNLNQHNADFRTLPNVPSCCPKFEDGSGTGFSLGLLYEYPVMKNLFFGLRAGYFVLNGKLSAEEHEWLNVNGEAVYGTLEHTLDVKLSEIGIEPLIGYRIFDELFIHGGLNIGFGNITKEYEHRERILEPSVGHYENGERERLLSNGDIDELSSVHFSLLGGMSYEIPLDRKRTWIIAPEVFYSHMLSNVISIDTVEWSINSLRFGVSIKYSPRPRPAPILREPWLGGSIEASSVDENNVESPIVTIKVEEYLSTNIKPLLTYVFFDENSSTLPSRYNQLSPIETKKFSIDQLYDRDAMETYYHVLNIVGKRMQEHPQAKIAIDGCNSNSGLEKNNKKLSLKRAETVRDYLMNVWKITPERMIIDSRNLPQEPSNVKEEDGIVENRRVEITSNTWEIIAPVTAKDTFRTATPPIVRFKNNIHSEAGIRDWNITASQDDKPLKTISGRGDMPEKVDWKIDLNQKYVPKSSDLLDYSFELIDNDGQVFSSDKKSIPIEQITIRKKKREQTKDKYIDRFSLILFSFDESTISFYNNKVVQLIQNAIKPNSVVKITGHTDRMGKDDYNDRLSKKRAEVIDKALNGDNIYYQGKGETELKYNNNLPEGRFYCRRVDIIVETPIEY